MGPSHHVRLGGCALSPARIYKTPLNDLIIDQEIYSQLYSSGLFEEMTMTTDEDEHSIEMHLPFVAKVFEKRIKEITIVPILVGSLSLEKQKSYAKILSKYLMDKDNLFIISSDFCHWGARFHYQFVDKSWGQSIHESIEKLDKMGMKIIESLDPNEFNSYLKKFGNTICGRHPIGLLLSCVKELIVGGGGGDNRSSSNHHHEDQDMNSEDEDEDDRRREGASNGRQPNGRHEDKQCKDWSLSFLDYAQSSSCKSMDDSSVSYAAASLVFKGK